ncbi:MAG TPA: hypothetical protein PKC98_01305, partial [Candidatus Melainabacteria bacterium]|nr:hypothetical protein [Candidatus Melainabacteria bacterium]
MLSGTTSTKASSPNTKSKAGNSLRSSSASRKFASFVVAVLLGTAQANVSLAIEDPQTAERLWSTPNLK